MTGTNGYERTCRDLQSRSVVLRYVTLSKAIAIAPAAGNKLHVTGVLCCMMPVTDHNDTVVKQEIAVGPTAGNGLNMTVYMDANRTTSEILGLVVFSDVDQNDVVNYSSVTHVEAGRP